MSSDYHNMARGFLLWEIYHLNHFHAAEHINRTKITSMKAPVNRWITREATIRA